MVWFLSCKDNALLNNHCVNDELSDSFDKNCQYNYKWSSTNGHTNEYNCKQVGCATKKIFEVVQFNLGRLYSKIVECFYACVDFFIYMMWFLDDVMS